MIECTRYQREVVERELGGPNAAEHQCPECEAETPRLMRLLRAGVALRAVVPDPALVESARHRFLARLERGGPGLVGLLALAGGFVLLGLAAAVGPDGDGRCAAPLLTAGAGIAGVALAALGGDAASRPGSGHVPRHGGTARAFALRPIGRRSVEPAPGGRDIMDGCAAQLSPSC